MEGKKDNPVEPKFVVANLDDGDRVRVRREKSIFDKGDASTWSQEI